MSGSKAVFNRRRLTSLQRGLDDALDRAKAKLLEETAAEMRSHVKVVSGATRDSIHVEGDTVVASEGAVPLELGTAHMAAQPFMRPAFEHVMQERAEDVLRREVEKEIR